MTATVKVTSRHITRGHGMPCPYCRVTGLQFGGEGQERDILRSLDCYR